MRETLSVKGAISLAAEVWLTPEEETLLRAWSRDRRARYRERALRARVLLKVAHGLGEVEVAALLAIDRHTVAKWREDFVRSRLASLLGAGSRRRGRPTGASRRRSSVQGAKHRAPRQRRARSSNG
jgi:hypothetical protein